MVTFAQFVKNLTRRKPRISTGLANWHTYYLMQFGFSFFTGTGVFCLSLSLFFPFCHRDESSFTIGILICTMRHVGVANVKRKRERTRETRDRVFDMSTIPSLRRRRMAHGMQFFVCVCVCENRVLTFRPLLLSYVHPPCASRHYRLFIQIKWKGIYIWIQSRWDSILSQIFCARLRHGAMYSEGLHYRKIIKNAALKGLLFRINIRTEVSIVHTLN